jgi:hypothetical protein
MFPSPLLFPHFLFLFLFGAAVADSLIRQRLDDLLPRVARRQRQP